MAPSKVQPLVRVLPRLQLELPPPLLQHPLAILRGSTAPEIFSFLVAAPLPASKLVGLWWTLAWIRRAAGPTCLAAGGPVAQPMGLAGPSGCPVLAPCRCGSPGLCARDHKTWVGVSPCVHPTCAHTTSTLHAVGGVGFCCRLEIHPAEVGAFAKNGSLDYNAAPVVEHAACHHMVKVGEEGYHGAVPVTASFGQNESLLLPAPDAQADEFVCPLVGLQLLAVAAAQGLCPQSLHSLAPSHWIV